MEKIVEILLKIILMVMIIIMFWRINKDFKLITKERKYEIKSFYNPLNSILNKSGKIQQILFYLVGILIFIYGILLSIMQQLEKLSGLSILGMVKIGIVALVVSGISMFVLYTIVAAFTFVLHHILKSIMEIIEKFSSSSRLPATISLIFPMILYVFLFFNVSLSTSTLKMMLITVAIIHFYALIGINKAVSVRYLFSEKLEKKDVELINSELIKTVFVWFLIIMSILYLEVFLTTRIDPNAFVFNSSDLNAVTTKIDLFYYLLICFSTVGFGDIIPNTGLGKVTTIGIAITSFLFLILFVSSMISRMQNKDI